MRWPQGVGRCLCLVEVVDCLTKDELDFLDVSKARDESCLSECPAIRQVDGKR